MINRNLVLFTAVIVGVAAPAKVAWAQQEQTSQVQAAGPQRIDMIVTGLSCPFCAYGLEKKLRKIEGLDSIGIDFKTGKVLMLVQDGSKATDERITQLVKDAGFEVAEIKRSTRTPGSPDG